MPRFIFGLAVVAAALALAWTAHSPTRGRPAVGDSTSGTPVHLKTTGEMLVTAEWFDLIFGQARESNKPDRGDTYRTLCVRLCDGFYFPISYSTRRERFSADAKQCEQKCPTGARLFLHRNPGEDVDAMVDLQGRPYRSLPTALLYQTKYVADCTCRGNPWDEVALARHRAYAETAARPKLAGTGVR
jgi:Protein of unknown function (DUF2865)